MAIHMEALLPTLNNRKSSPNLRFPVPFIMTKVCYFSSELMLELRFPT